MRSLTFLLRVLLFVSFVRAKHDGLSTDNEDQSSSTSSSALPATSASSLTAQSTATFTSVSTTTASSTTVASTAIPSGALQFTPPGNTTMCEPAIFTWVFNSNASVPLTIMVTNERAVSAQSSSPNQAPLVEHTLSTPVDARVCVVSWPHADVPAGAYSLLATDTAHTGAVFAQSSSFFVNAGSDTSCLNSSASASASSTSATETAGGSGSSNDTADPSAGSSGPKSMSVGAIVGTIAGILVGVGGLLLVFSLPRLRRRILSSKAPQRPGGPYILF